MRFLFSFFVVFFAACAQSASPTGATGEGSPYWAYRQAVTTSTCILNKAQSTCHVFPAGFDSLGSLTRVEVTGDAAADLCWSFDPSDAITANFIMDSATCPGLRIEVDGDRVWDEPARSRMIDSQSGNYSAGLCSVAQSYQGETLYAPCDADDDCTSYGGGTCDTTPTLEMQRNAGLFLWAVSDSGTANITVRTKVVDK